MCTYVELLRCCGVWVPAFAGTTVERLCGDDNGGGVRTQHREVCAGATIGRLCRDGNGEAGTTVKRQLSILGSQTDRSQPTHAIPIAACRLAMRSPRRSCAGAGLARQAGEDCRAVFGRRKLRPAGAATDA